MRKSGFFSNLLERPARPITPRGTEACGRRASERRLSDFIHACPALGSVRAKRGPDPTRLSHSADSRRNVSASDAHRTSFRRVHRTVTTRRTDRARAPGALRAPHPRGRRQHEVTDDGAPDPQNGHPRGVDAGWLALQRSVRPRATRASRAAGPAWARAPHAALCGARSVRRLSARRVSAREGADTGFARYARQRPRRRGYMST